MISVIVPAYNAESVIHRCLESIFAQTYKNTEVIVIDDGSNDNTASIVRSFSDAVLIRQTNAGQGAARNTGLEAARGRYAAFVDADDTIDRCMLERLYYAAEEHSADVVQCNLANILPGNKQSIQLPPFEGTVSPTDNYMAEFMAAKARHSFEVCNKLFRMDLIRKHSLKFHDTKQFFSEDLLFNMEAVRYIKRIHFIKEPYYNYYKNADSHFHSGDVERAEKLQSLFEFYISSYPDIAEQAYYLGFVVQLWNIGALVGVNNAEAINMLKSGFMQKCTSAAWRLGSSRHKAYAVMTTLPLVRLAAARIKYLR